MLEVCSVMRYFFELVRECVARLYRTSSVDLSLVAHSRGFLGAISVNTGLFTVLNAASITATLE